MSQLCKNETKIVNKIKLINLWKQKHIKNLNILATLYLQLILARGLCEEPLGIYWAINP
jgi:hypothetical protein